MAYHVFEMMTGLAFLSNRMSHSDDKQLSLPKHHYNCQGFLMM